MKENESIDDIVKDIKSIRKILREPPMVFKVKRDLDDRFEVGKRYDLSLNETFSQYNSFEYLGPSRIDGHSLFSAKLTDNVYLPDVFSGMEISLIKSLEDHIAGFMQSNHKQTIQQQKKYEERLKANSHNQDKFNKVTKK